MKNTSRLSIIMALMLIPGLYSFLTAATSYIGQTVQSTDLKRVDGSVVPTGNGTTASGGVQRVVIASDQSTIPVNVTASTTTAYQGGAPWSVTFPSAQSVNVSNTPTVNANINAGSNSIGTVGIDAGANSIGTVGLNTGSNSIGTVGLNTGSNSIGAVGLNAGSNNIGTVSGSTVTAIAPIVALPVVTKITATSTSAEALPANPTRKGLEIDTDCANNKDVAINFGASAAVFASHKIMPPCSNWQPPPGVVVTSAIQVISDTGSQAIRIIEYP